LQPWSGPVATGQPHPFPGSAKGYYLGEQHNRWRLEITQPAGSVNTYSGDIYLYGGSFIKGSGLKLEAIDSFTIHQDPPFGQYLTFSFVDRGGTDGIEFGPANTVSTIAFDLEVNGVFLPAGNIYLGTSGAHPTAAHFVVPGAP
jgi:hypothetical protein